MIKKSLSLKLIVCMIMSLFIITPVSAGAPVVLDGATQVVFDQSFGGLSGANGAPGFTIATESGSAWNYMDYFIIGDGGNRSVTSPVVNLTDADNWTFKTKVSHSYNSYDIYLAYAGGKGYILRNNRGTKTLTLYKDTVTTALGSVSLDSYNVDTTITVTYNKASNKLTVKNSKNSNVIEYTPEDATDVPNLNGYFKVQGNSAGVFTVFNMYLEKFTDKVTIDQWKYDKTFTTANTQAELEADGFTFSKATTPATKGLLYQNKTFNFGPNGKAVSGDYYFETQVSRSYNTYYLDFNHSSNGYYRILYGVNDDDTAKNKPWIKLQKYDATLAKTLDLAVVSRTSGLSAGHTRIYKGTVKTLENGSVDINIDIYNGTTLDATLSYNDTDTDTVAIVSTSTDAETGEEVTTTTNVDTGAPLTSGKLRLVSNSTGSNSYMKYLKMYSIMSEDEQGTGTKYTEQIIDKTFTSADTKASIAPLGFSFERTNYTPTSTDANGFDISASSQYFLYKNANLGEEYSFTSYTYRTMNYTDIFFNYIDSNNYYRLYYGAGSSSTIYFKLFKKVNGTETEVSKGTLNWNNHGRNAWSTNTVTLTKNTDGSMTITAVQQQSGKAAVSITYTDASPLKGGYIRIRPSNGGKIKSFAISHSYYESSTNGETPVYLGRFSNDAGAIKEYVKGNIYFEYPTAILGSYKAVATLYEDYKMTEMKVLNPIDLYSGKVKLFDTTSSTAENIKVRVYFLENGETLKLVADEIYELN